MSSTPPHKHGASVRLSGIFSCAGQPGPFKRAANDWQQMKKESICTSQMQSATASRQAHLRSYKTQRKPDDKRHFTPFPHHMQTAAAVCAATQR